MMLQQNLPPRTGRAECASSGGAVLEASPKSCDVYFHAGLSLHTPQNLHSLPPGGHGRCWKNAAAGAPWRRSSHLSNKTALISKNSSNSSLSPEPRSPSPYNVEDERKS